jgi:hypothetical protein
LCSVIHSSLAIHSVDSRKDLLWDCFKDPPDLGKNVFGRASCESGDLALQATKQEEVAGCTKSRIRRMCNPVGFGSAHSSSELLVARQIRNVRADSAIHQLSTAESIRQIVRCEACSPAPQLALSPG